MNKANKELALKKAKILDRLFEAMQDFNTKITFEGNPIKAEFKLEYGYGKNIKNFDIGKLGEEHILDELEDALYQITEGRMKQ